MSARDLSKELEIKTPCTADWDSMIGNDRIRFCEHCNLTVNDLSQLTPKRVRRLIIKSKGRLCVRYRLLPDGAPLLKAVPKKIHTIGRRASRIAAGAFTATLSLATAVPQSASDNVIRQRVSAHQQVGSLIEPWTQGSEIKGKVTDTHGAVIQGAGVTLGTDTTSHMTGTVTDSAGDYKFDGLQPGTYHLTIEAVGFAQHETAEIVVAENETRLVNSSLQIAPIYADVEVTASDTPSQTVMGGAIAVMVVEEAAEPLIKAALNDDIDALRAVLTRSNVNVRDKNLGTTALEHAVRNGNREMVQVLLAAGADVNSRNNSRETVLMKLGEQSTADIVWDLINAGAKVDLKDDEGDTALIEAAMEKNLALLTALLHAGAKVDARNNQGQTALMMAASNDQIDNLRALIRAGADMNARDSDGDTALDYAIDEDHQKIIKLLQSYGAIKGDNPKPIAVEAQ